MNDLINMKSIANEMNNRTFTHFFYHLMLIATSIFEWTGLEELGIDEKWIERMLFTDGKCIFFKDPGLGLMVSKVNPNSPLNAYDEPTELMPYATNFMYTGPRLENDVNCVLIRNNDLMLPTSPDIQLYSYKLANISRTIDVNIDAQKMPLIITCPEKQRLTLRNVIKQRNDNEPVIYGDKDFEMDSIRVLNTDAPIVFDKLEYQKHMIYNECMTFLGINNANQDKRERLVDDEVQANNEQIEVSFNTMLKARERACKQINKIFGTNISVKKRAKTNVLADIEPGSKGLNESKGGSENG